MINVLYCESVNLLLEYKGQSAFVSFRFSSLRPLHPDAVCVCVCVAIYPTTTLTPIGQTLPQPPQVIQQQQQQREGKDMITTTANANSY